jgi:hypothetical protein
MRSTSAASHLPLGGYPAFGHSVCTFCPWGIVEVRWGGVMVGPLNFIIGEVYMVLPHLWIIRFNHLPSWQVGVFDGFGRLPCIENDRSDGNDWSLKI